MNPQAPRPHADIPVPSFGVGQRIRCIIDTLAPGYRDDFRGEQLYGRAGTVHSTRWDGRNRRWQVVVSADQLTRATMPERVTLAHRPGELVPVAAWAWLTPQVGTPCATA